MAKVSREVLFEDLDRRLAASAAGGGPERVAKQNALGKLTARQRVEALLDPGSFFELDALVTHQCKDFGMDRKVVPGDGVITGHGTIDGRRVHLFSQDCTVFGGSLSSAGARKICKVIDLAADTGTPLIGLNDGGGARIQEGVASLDGYAALARRIAHASGWIPQISAILGACAGGASYTPAGTDFLFMVEKTSFMFVTGPEVIRQATREEVTQEALGGAMTHFSKTGVAHVKTPDDGTCLQEIRRLLSYLPDNSGQKPPRLAAPAENGHAGEELDEIIPEDPSSTYDVKALINGIVDEDSFFELQAAWAKNIVIGLSRIGGFAVGIVANQPKHLAGALDINASLKAARFIRFCDAFEIPVFTILDTPGYLPGTHQEYNGIIRHGAKLGFAYAEATTPTITLVTRKAYGGSYGAMGSKQIGCDVNLAYPSAEIAVMAPESSARILYRNELTAAGENAAELYKQRVEELRSILSNPYVAAARGAIDAVIKPRETRGHVLRSLEQLRTKNVVRRWKKHSNIPL